MIRGTHRGSTRIVGSELYFLKQLSQLGMLKTSRSSRTCSEGSVLSSSSRLEYQIQLGAISKHEKGPWSRRLNLSLWSRVGHNNVASTG
jgi:hypothetical protein